MWYIITAVIHAHPNATLLRPYHHDCLVIQIMLSVFDSKDNESTHSYVRVIVGKKGVRNVNGKSEHIFLWKSPEYHQVSDLTLVPNFHYQKGDYWLAFNAIDFKGRKLVQIGDDIIYGKTLAEVIKANKYDGEPVDDSDDLIMHIVTG